MSVEFIKDHPRSMEDTIQFLRKNKLPFGVGCVNMRGKDVAFIAMSSGEIIVMEERVVESMIDGLQKALAQLKSDAKQKAGLN